MCINCVKHVPGTQQHPPISAKILALSLCTERFLLLGSPIRGEGTSRGGRRWRSFLLRGVLSVVRLSDFSSNRTGSATPTAWVCGGAIRGNVLASAGSELITSLRQAAHDADPWNLRLAAVDRERRPLRRHSGAELGEGRRSSWSTAPHTVA